ncbi:hypothetical protein HCN44_001090 [Aphidius gifuensis]|uniref:DnaJ homolog subfamily C member 22 n=1 Tax=Aphidius gifuensis TaxID=684658 RepID=A0A835CLR8_APHGI|nr:dnaJ homolog subfamily C member 22 [Aphidius gifuensis]KAF7988517.1 hypothetical protein HCN44_001090 [Aphidius gifuensis]
MNNGHVKQQVGTSKQVNLNGDAAMVVEKKKLKSLFLTYVLWLFGGIFGAHHIYLERDFNAIIWLTTFGGYFGIGWLRDIYRIPTYVNDANDEPIFIEKFKTNIRQFKKPPFSTVRFLGQVAVSAFWGQLALWAVPEEEVHGFNLRYLLYLVPVFVALGVWIVGNIGREQGGIKWTLLASFCMYPTLYYIGDESTWLSLMAVVATLVFETFSKEWRLKPRKKKSIIKRFTVISFAVLLFCSMWASFFYFNASITDSQGEEIKLSEAVKHFFTSPVWLDFMASISQTWQQMKHQGFWATWSQLVDLTDPRGEINAYRVLGLTQTSSQSEVTAKWRSLSKEYHPDKVKGTDEEKKIAQEKFMEIQSAYELLSSTKNRRTKKNRRA